MFSRLLAFGIPGNKFLKKALILLAALLLLVWGGITGFAWWNYEAAQKALEKDDLDSALADISRTLIFWPNSGKSHFLAARIQRLRESFKEAEKHLNACQDLEGRTEQLQLEWLLFRLQAGEVAEVQHGLWICLQEKLPESSWILEALARSYMRDLRFRLASKCLEDWLILQPDQLRALALRAKVQEHMEYREGALADYQRIVDLNPDNWKARLRLADMLLFNKKTVEALEHLEIVEKTQGDRAEFLQVLAKARVLEGKTSEARALFEKVIALNWKNPEVFHQLGQIELQEGRPAQAESCFRAALKTDPTFGLAYFSLYSSLKQQNQIEKANKELRNYKDFKEGMEKLKKHLDDFEKQTKSSSLIEAGGLIMRLGNPDLGRQFLLRALEMEPYNRKAHELLVEYYTKKNQLQEAAKHQKVLGEL